MDLLRESYWSLSADEEEEDVRCITPPEGFQDENGEEQNPLSVNYS